jgi:glycosyltransferase involved in cell wall biosynthesis
LFQSKSQADECASYDSKLRDRCLVVKPSTQESALVAAKSSLNPFDEERKAIVNVGGINPRKAQHRTIEAFKHIADKIPDSDLHFVGGFVDKNYFAGLEKLAENSGIGHRIFFHGHRTDYLNFIFHAKLLVQSSEQEGVSRVLREAMFLKVPIVSYNLPGTRDLLTADKEALLVDPEDILALGAAMVRALTENNLADSLTSQAFEAYMRNNSYEVYKKSVDDMIKGLLSARQHSEQR